MMDFADIEDIALRLFVALAAGAALGFNRELNGNPLGVRTLAIVSLGSALAVMSVGGAENIDAASRVIQGLLTGIGFLGAGVIIRPRGEGDVQGLTTAACTYLDDRGHRRLVRRRRMDRDSHRHCADSAGPGWRRLDQETLVGD
jgi:uncharacterized membrane protein YhiD involved in acid resistance